MSVSTRLARLALGLVPDRWRESVERDLVEVAARRGLTGAARDRWIAWEALRVAVRLRTGRVASVDADLGERTSTNDRHRQRPSLRVARASGGSRRRRSPSSRRSRSGSARRRPCSPCSITCCSGRCPACARPIVSSPSTSARPTSRASQAYGHGSALAAFRAAGAGDRSRSALPTTRAAGRVRERRRRRVREGRSRSRAAISRRSASAPNRPAVHRSTRRTRRVHAVALISDAVWRSRFGGEARVLGRTIVVNGQPLEIVGVARHLPRMGHDAHAESRRLDASGDGASADHEHHGESTSISELVGRLACRRDR